MDKASALAQKAIHLAVTRSRQSEPPSQLGPMDYEAAVTEVLRESFRRSRKARSRKERA